PVQMDRGNALDPGRRNDRQAPHKTNQVNPTQRNDRLALPKTETSDPARRNDRQSLPRAEQLVLPQSIPGNDHQSPAVSNCNPVYSPNGVPTYNLLSEHPLTDSVSEPKQRYYFQTELLLWWMKSMDAPPLLTTAMPPNMGFIGGPTTQILYGNG